MLLRRVRTPIQPRQESWLGGVIATLPSRSTAVARKCNLVSTSEVAHREVEPNCVFLARLGTAEEAKGDILPVSVSRLLYVQSWRLESLWANANHWPKV